MTDDFKTLEHGILFLLGEDSKYGRVFVENPPASMMERYKGRVDDPEFNFHPPGHPTDEPLFILRGTDPETPTTIEDYGRNNMSSKERRKPSHEDAQKPPRSFLLAVGDRADAVRAWQENNPEKVKVAD